MIREIHWHRYIRLHLVREAEDKRHVAWRRIRLVVGESEKARSVCRRATQFRFRFWQEALIPCDGDEYWLLRSSSESSSMQYAVSRPKRIARCMYGRVSKSSDS